MVRSGPFIGTEGGFDVSGCRPFPFYGGRGSGRQLNELGKSGMQEWNSVIKITLLRGDAKSGLASDLETSNRAWVGL